MSNPTDRRYSNDHEWVTNEAPIRVGITQHAATALGDAVYVDLPEVGDEVTAGEACGEIESTKAVSDLLAPVSGTVMAINDAAVDNPEIITNDPFGEGWLYEVEVTADGEDLMDADTYTEWAKNQ